MKKTFITILFSSAVAVSSAAVPALSSAGSRTVNIPLEASHPSNPVAVDRKGDIIVTGVFEQDFSFNGSPLEAIGSSAYILKYNQDLSEAWGVALVGASTITAIDTDSEGNIYVAGTFADEVEFGTTFGYPIIKEGMMVDYAYTMKENASFIAKYTPDGRVLAVESFVPEYLPALVETGMYFPEDGDVYFAINHLEVDGDRVYASALYTGTTKHGDVDFDGSYYDAWGGGFYFMDMRSASVFSLSTADLSGCRKDANFAIAYPAMFAMEQASSVAFTVENGVIYAGFVGTGSFSMQVGGNSYDPYFYADGDTGKNEYGYVMASSAPGSAMVSLSTKSDNTNSAIFTIAGLVKSGDALYAVGNFDKTCPAVNGDGVDATGGTDIFVADVNASSMSLISVTPYAHDEGSTLINGETRPNYELARSVVAIDGALYINTVVNDFNRNYVGPASFWYDGGSYSRAQVPATGVAGTNGVAAMVQSDMSTLSINKYSYQQSGITDIFEDADDADAPVEYYDLQGRKVTDPAPGIYIRRQGKKVQKVKI